MALLMFKLLALVELSYVALSYLALIKLSSVALDELSYWALTELSFVALSGSKLRGSFNIWAPSCCRTELRGSELLGSYRNELHGS